MVQTKSETQVKRDLEKGMCACCNSNETVTSCFHKIDPNGKVNGVPLVLPRTYKKESPNSSPRKHLKVCCMMVR